MCPIVDGSLKQTRRVGGLDEPINLVTLPAHCTRLKKSICLAVCKKELLPLGPMVLLRCLLKHTNKRLLLLSHKNTVICQVYFVPEN